MPLCDNTCLLPERMRSTKMHLFSQKRILGVFTMKGQVPQSRRRTRVARAGFTLIELLVVIAIIAIVASLLRPALSSAKSAAQSAKCKSNLKQLSLALNMYVSDFHCYPQHDLNGRVSGTRDNMSLTEGDSTIARIASSLFPRNDIQFAQTRHRGRLNVTFCDGHVEPFKVHALYFEETDEAYKRWNRDNEVHRLPFW
jgi:prepilin-type N-terminal cleavage/methylation domain-containing protein/prepilin-type processing-associated H-X9-DG protein